MKQIAFNKWDTLLRVKPLVKLSLNCNPVLQTEGRRVQLAVRFGFLLSAHLPVLKHGPRSSVPVQRLTVPNWKEPKSLGDLSRSEGVPSSASLEVFQARARDEATLDGYLREVPVLRPERW